MNNRKIEVIDYQSAWPDKFRDEQRLLEGILDRSNLISIHHIGSTAVPELCAKPIIDILIQVRCHSLLDGQSKAFESIGYAVLGECGLPGRRHFQKGGDQRSHHIHVYEQGHQDITRHIAFRDYLHQFISVRDSYGLIKMEGARKYHNDIKGYMAHKNAFIKTHELLALEWYLNSSE